MTLHRRFETKANISSSGTPAGSEIQRVADILVGGLGLHSAKIFPALQLRDGALCSIRAAGGDTTIEIARPSAHPFGHRH